MKRTKSTYVLVSLCLFICSAITDADTATGKRGVVASVQPLATAAGMRAFRQGGNAIDAAVATALTLGVVDGHNSGLGGGCFVLIRRANGELVAIDGREMAPAAATRDMYVRDGKADPLLSQFGPLAIGIPGALAAYEKAMLTCGRLKLRSLLEHAAEIADAGFPIDRVYAGNLQTNLDLLAKFPATRTMLLKSDGSAYVEGEMLRLPDLARTYRQIALDGSDWFYRGEFADRVEKWMQTNGGLITAKDFTEYRAALREPVLSSYRDHQVVGFPPPSSGGVHVAQILNILNHFDMRQLFNDDPVTAYHIIAEAMKLAFADRAHWLGDADFVKVPRGLATQAYAARLAKQIDLKRATKVDNHGLPKNWESDVYGKHTTHITTADAEGNWVAITATVNTSFGSKVVVPGTGLILNNEMDDFSAQPGVPNVFGLVGAEANAVESGKRPLSSMSPTIVLKDGQPILTVGAAGGPMIITQAVLCIVNYIDAGLALEQSIARPRLHHQWRPDQLYVEESLSKTTRDALEQRGHRIEVLSSAGAAQAISQGANGLLIGVTDPRIPGAADGW